jgi:hypothetical protein
MCGKAYDPRFTLVMAKRLWEVPAAKVLAQIEALRQQKEN